MRRIRPGPFDAVNFDAQFSARSRTIGVYFQRFTISDKFLRIEPAALRTGFVPGPAVEPQLRQREPLLDRRVALIAFALGHVAIDPQFVAHAQRWHGAKAMSAT